MFKYIEISRLWLFQQFEKMDLIMHITLTLFAFDESIFDKGIIMVIAANITIPLFI